MPKPTIAGTPHDRRRKLTDADRAKVRELHAEGWTVGRLARAYQVSSTAIGHVLHPERVEAGKRRLAERGGHYKLYGVALKGYMRRWRKRNKKRVAGLAACGNVDKAQEVTP